MTYASVSDITTELKKLNISATNSSIKNAEIENFLTQTDEEINLYLNKRYLLPISVSATEALEVLKKIEIDFVAYRVEKIINLKKSQIIPNREIRQEITTGSAYRESKKLLENISKGKFDLEGAEFNTSYIGPLESYNSKFSVTPEFKKDEEQW